MKFEEQYKEKRITRLGIEYKYYGTFKNDKKGKEEIQDTLCIYKRRYITFKKKGEILLYLSAVIRAKSCKPSK